MTGDVHDEVSQRHPRSAFQSQSYLCRDGAQGREPEQTGAGLVHTDSRSTRYSFRREEGRGSQGVSAAVAR